MTAIRLEDALSLGRILSAAVPILSAVSNDDEGDPDAALIRRIRRGDRRAFDELFLRHADDVHRRLTRLIGPHPDREDLVQEVFIAAFKGLDRFRGESRFSTWLYRVVVNVSYGHLRRRRRRPLDLDAAIDVELADDPRLGPEARASQREQLVRVLGFLDRLKPKKRVAFVLRVVEGMSLQEIARIVDAKPAAVGMRVRHARRELDAMIARDRKRQGVEVPA